MSEQHPSLVRFERDLKAENLRPSTIRSYVGSVQRFMDFLEAPPSRATESDIRNYLLELSQRLRPASVNQSWAALKRFYRDTLHKPEVVARVRRLKDVAGLPTVLSGSEIQRLLVVTESAKYRALIISMYGMGLRVGEACAMRVDDIDSERMMVRIPFCKGNPRYVPLPNPVLLALRDYWRQFRPKGPQLFPGGANGHLSTSQVARVVKKLALLAGIDKTVSTHSLRHSYATHLLDSGADMRTVQVLLGHASLRSTMAYARMSRAQLEATPSPVELLGTKAGRVFG